MAVLLVAGQVLLLVPPTVRADAPQEPASDDAEAPAPISVNRQLPDVTPPSKGRVSESPADEEFLRVRVLEEPLVPASGEMDPRENQALARALTAFRGRIDPDDVSSLTRFLQVHPRSRWRASLLLNLGILYRWNGYFTKALEVWEESWALSKEEAGDGIEAVADRAAGELAAMNARVGRHERLVTLFAELQGRDFRGPATELIRGARQGLELMESEPHEAFRCGPYALDRIRASAHPATAFHPKILNARSTTQGTSLRQVVELAEELGMGYQMAKRAPGSEILVPSVAHWQVGHFSALTEERGGRYRVQDPTFGKDLWVSPAAIDEEGSGYFLVPSGPLPRGWHRVEAQEGSTVWGRGHVQGKDQGDTGGGDGQMGGNGKCEKGMAVYSFHAMLASLHVTDTPVSYQPPVGPGVSFSVTYNQKEANQPSIFTYSNLGQKWTTDWISYVIDDPTNPSRIPDVYLPGGGTDVYTAVDFAATGQTLPQRDSQTIVTRVSGNPVYERVAPDGSKEVFALSDGATSYPRKIFLTEIVDPAGNRLALTYDASLRLVAITDAIGQVTTLSYGLADDSLKITRVADPFGRAAILEYAGNPKRLVRITDVIGITSEFVYGQSDFMSSLTTPYGVTSFKTGIVLDPSAPGGLQEWIEATDPLGAKERLEAHEHDEVPDDPSTVPTGVDISNTVVAFGNNTYYWDKKALADFPGDFTKARNIRWASTGDNPKVATSVPVSAKEPLENRVWYTYAGQVNQYQAGTTNRPSTVTRVLSNSGGNKIEQKFNYEYNYKGQVTRATDPVGRTTIYGYASNEIDLTEVRQSNGQTTDLLERRTYNSQHAPLTVTDAAGQTTSYTYTSVGRVLTMVTPTRGGLTLAQRTTTYSYDANGYLQTVTGPLSGTTTAYTYDAHGRVRTETDPDNYTLTYDYDALDRPTRTTYLDGTYEETVYNRLDPEKQRDRLGRWSHTFYDALRRPVAMRDSLGRTTTLRWCNCGSLEKVLDGGGNATTWERDLQGRVTRAIRADGSDATLTYENTTGRIKQLRDAKQQLTEIQYFADDNWKQITFSNTEHPTPNVSFTYDPVYNRLATMTDGAGTTTYSYNPVTAPPSLGAGLLASADGSLANDLIAYTYDELGRVASRSGNGVALSRSFDALGRITGEANALGAFSYDYDGVSDRLTTLTYPSGQTTIYTYFGNTQDHRLQDLHNKLPGGATLSRFQYTYDPTGAIKSWSQQADSGPAKVYDLGHDAASQLTAATLRTTDPTPTILKRYRYEYDKAENRTGEQVDDLGMAATHNVLNALTALQPGGSLRFGGSLSETATVTVQGKPGLVTTANQFEGSAPVSSGTSSVAVAATDPSGNTRTNTYQVTSSGSAKTLAYDAAGNLTNDGARTFEWDAVNRLRAINQGTHRSEFIYDGWGHRVRIVEKDNGVVTADRRFLWCGMEICEERDASGGVVTKRFFADGEWEGGTAFFYTTDHLGSIRELTDVTGTLRARYDYDPYGRLSKISGDKDSVFTFTGHFNHNPSGLALTPFRAYDPHLGRWISQDPIGLHGGINVYGYADGMPVDVRDPLGLLAGPFVFPPATAVFAVFIGGWMIGTWIDQHIIHPPVDPQGSANADATPKWPRVPRSPEDEKQAQEEHDRYKRRCSESPPPGLSFCEAERWKRQRNADCRRMMQEWDAKWYPERHAEDIQRMQRAVEKCDEKIRRRCGGL